MGKHTQEDGPLGGSELLVIRQTCFSHGEKQVGEKLEIWTDTLASTKGKTIIPERKAVQSPKGDFSALQSLILMKIISWRFKKWLSVGKRRRKRKNPHSKQKFTYIYSDNWLSNPIF